MGSSEVAEAAARRAAAEEAEALAKAPGLRRRWRIPVCK